MQINAQNFVLNTIDGDAFVLVNKKLAKRLGFLEAGLLGELLSTYRYAKKENNFFKNGTEGEWFYLTAPKVEEMLGIKKKQFLNAIKALKKEGAILVEQKGLPAKNFYIINWEFIGEILSENALEPAPRQEEPKRDFLESPNGTSREAQTEPLEASKGHLIKKNYKKDFIKKNFDDDDYIKERARENVYLQYLIEFINEKELPSSYIKNIVKLCLENNLLEFSADDIESQFNFMVEKMNRGEKINVFETYFVNGLKRKTENRTISQLEKLREEKRLEQEMEKRKNRDTSFYYNWLEN